MNILGWVHHDETHDTSAAIVCDGHLVAAVEEERFTRRKHEDRLPIHAIDFCLRQSGLTMAEIDLIALPDKPFRTGRDSYLAGLRLRELGGSQTRVRSRRWVHKVALDLASTLGASFNWQMNPQAAAERSRSDIR